MGGDRPTTVQKSKPKEKVVVQAASKAKEAKTIQPGDQELEIHENSGEVHFHDRKSNLKVAVPVSEFWGAWSKLKTLQISEWSYFDAKEKTIVQIEVGRHNNSLEANVSVEECSGGVGDTFSSIDKFISNR